MTKQTYAFPGSAGAGSSDGADASARAPFTVGGDLFDRGQDRLYRRTLRGWVRQAERDQGQRAWLTTYERERMKALERENRELRQANEILQKASAYFAQAELDHRFKPLYGSSMNTAASKESSRSASNCRSLRRPTTRMRRGSPIRRSVWPGRSGIRCCVPR